MGEYSPEEMALAEGAYQAYRAEVGDRHPAGHVLHGDWGKVTTVDKRGWVAVVNHLAAATREGTDEDESDGDEALGLDGEGREGGPDYDAMTVTELQDAARGYQPSPLSTSGTRAQLIARLRAADESKSGE
jgi:hypothetical protein